MQKINLPLKFIGILTSLLCIGQIILAQDVIYKKDGNLEEVKILGIEQSTIKYLKQENSVPTFHKAQVSDVAFVFFENGQYLPFPHFESAPMGLKQLPNLSYDLIVTIQQEVIAGKILEAKDGLIRYKVMEDLNGRIYSRIFEGLVACIYQNGKHALFKHPVDALPYLTSVHDIIKPLFKDRKNIQAKITPVYLPKPDKVVAEESSANKESTKESGTKNKVTNEFGKLTDINFDDFSAKALKKIEDLGAYLEVVADKKTETAEANKAIDLAVELFVSDEASVEISSANSEQVRSRPIAKYLNNLKRLKYDKVEVTWADINYVSDFREGNDGNYYGTVSVKQTFQGFKDGEIVYSDITEKHVEVVLKSLEKQMDGKTNMVWDVLLSDLGVYNTIVKG